MAPRQYRFVTNWCFTAPVEAVRTAIVDSLRWPEWWPGVRDVSDVAPAAAGGVEGARRYTFRSVLPYDVVFVVIPTRVEEYLLEGESSGDLEGTGRWLISPRDDATLVRYVWEVDTTKRWMNVLAPLLHLPFVWNHHAIMRAGEAGLRRRLDDTRAASH